MFDGQGITSDINNGTLHWNGVEFRLSLIYPETMFIVGYTSFMYVSRHPLSVRVTDLSFGPERCPVVLRPVHLRLSTSVSSLYSNFKFIMLIYFSVSA